VPLAGFPDTKAQYLTVTVLEAETQAVNEEVAVGTEPFGTPSITLSPLDAPVTVMVRSLHPIEA
jgi:hypothetical protein